MARVERTSQAESDLTDIFMYIATDNLEAAEEVLRSIGAKCDLLAESPGMGRERSDLHKNVRSFPAGHYVIFYEARQNGILVLRVLHGARDMDHLMD